MIFYPSPLSRLFRSQKGAAAVEFGLVVPVLAMLILGATDLALAVSAKLRLQQAAARSIEMINVAGLNSTALDALPSEAASAAGVDVANVGLEKWLECNAVRQSDFDGTCANGEQTARYVALTINGTYAPLFSIGFKALGLATNGTVPITGKASVRLQ